MKAIEPRPFVGGRGFETVAVDTKSIDGVEVNGAAGAPWIGKSGVVDPFYKVLGLIVGAV